MQAYKAYYEGGNIVTEGNPAIPEGSELIITVIGQSAMNKAARQRRAFIKFIKNMETTPDLPQEFDEIINSACGILRN